MRTFRLALTLLLASLTLACAASGLVVVGPTGQLAELVMRNSNITGTLSLGSVPAGGRIIAAYDFDQNGSTDLVLQYDPDGSGSRPQGTFLWRYNGEMRIGVTQLGGIPSSFTESAGTCDLNNDGNREFLLWNPSNHAVKAFEVLKNSPYAGGERNVIPGGLGLSFKRVFGAGDANGDLAEDLILQDEVTRQLKVRLLVGRSTLSFGNPITSIDPTDVAVGVLKYPGFPEFWGVIFNASDGSSRHDLLILQGEDIFVSSTIEFPEIYRTWPIVAVVP